MNNSTSRLLRLSDVRERIPLSKAAIYQKIASGEFPAPYRYGRSALWSEAEINDLVERIRAGQSWNGPSSMNEEVTHE